MCPPQRSSTTLVTCAASSGAVTSLIAYSVAFTSGRSFAHMVPCNTSRTVAWERRDPSLSMRTDAPIPAGLSFVEPAGCQALEAMLDEIIGSQPLSIDLAAHPSSSDDFAVLTGVRARRLLRGRRRSRRSGSRARPGTVGARPSDLRRDRAAQSRNPAARSCVEVVPSGTRPAPTLPATASPTLDRRSSPDSLPRIPGSISSGSSPRSSSTRRGASRTARLRR